MNWTEKSVQLHCHCTDSTKRTNWQFGLFQFNSLLSLRTRLRWAFYGRCRTWRCLTMTVECGRRTLKTSATQTDLTRWWHLAIYMCSLSVTTARRSLCLISRTATSCEERKRILIRSVNSKRAQFLRAKAATALARLGHRNSVRPSVCLSDGWISQKRCKLGSPNLHATSAVWKILVSGTVKLFHKFEGGHPEPGRQMRGGWVKFAIFG